MSANQIITHTMWPYPISQTLVLYSDQTFLAPKRWFFATSTAWARVAAPAFKSASLDGGVMMMLKKLYCHKEIVMMMFKTLCFHKENIMMTSETL